MYDAYVSRSATPALSRRANAACISASLTVRNWISVETCVAVARTCP